MRGKAVFGLPLMLFAGITPAYAGKRVTIFWKGEWGRDHPRVCGEKGHLIKVRLIVSGSPPRMRGKAAIAARRGPAARITPAYAGKRQIFALFWSLSWDHPRVCGEKRRKT